MSEYICGKCHKPGSGQQGHHWKYCKVSRKDERFHFCCPGDCEIYGAKTTAEVAPEAAFAVLSSDHGIVAAESRRRHDLQDPARGHTFVFAVWVRGSTTRDLSTDKERYRDDADFDEPITVATRAWNLHDALQNVTELPLDEWTWTDDPVED